MKEIKESCYKGTRILIGNDKRTIINKMCEYLIQKEYQEIAIPVIQPQETFENKVGVENNNLMFNFTDRGNRRWYWVCTRNRPPDAAEFLTGDK